MGSSRSSSRGSRSKALCQPASRKMLTKQKKAINCGAGGSRLNALVRRRDSPISRRVAWRGVAVDTPKLTRPNALIYTQSAVVDII